MSLVDDVVKQTRGKGGRLIKLDGPSGVGKTWQARSIIQGLPELGIPGLRTLIVSTERKLKTLEDLNPEIYTIEWCDYPDPRQPNDYERFLADPRRNLFKLFYQVRNEEHPYECLYFDSGMRWASKLLFEICGVNSTVNADARSDYWILMRKMKLMMDHLASLVDPTTSKKPVHLVVTFGVDPEIDPVEGVVKVMSAVDGRKIAPIVNYYFDDVIHLRIKLGSNGETIYVARLAAEIKTDAKLSTAITLPDEIGQPNLFKLMCILDGKLPPPTFSKQGA